MAVDSMAPTKPTVFCSLAKGASEVVIRAARAPAMKARVFWSALVLQHLHTHHVLKVAGGEIHSGVKDKELLVRELGGSILQGLHHGTKARDDQIILAHLSGLDQGALVEGGVHIALHGVHIAAVSGGVVAEGGVDIVVVGAAAQVAGDHVIGRAAISAIAAAVLVAVVIPAAAGEHTQQHHQCQRHGQQLQRSLFHLSSFLSSNPLYLSDDPPRHARGYIFAAPGWKQANQIYVFIGKIYTIVLLFVELCDKNIIYLPHLT